MLHPHIDVFTSVACLDLLIRCGHTGFHSPFISVWNSGDVFAFDHKLNPICSLGSVKSNFDTLATLVAMKPDYLYPCLCNNNDSASCISYHLSLQLLAALAPAVNIYKPTHTVPCPACSLPPFHLVKGSLIAPSVLCWQTTHDWHLPHRSVEFVAPVITG